MIPESDGKTVSPLNYPLHPLLPGVLSRIRAGTFRNPSAKLCISKYEIKRPNKLPRVIRRSDNRVLSRPQYLENRRNNLG